MICRVIQENADLQHFCEKLDNAISKVRPSEIYINGEFLKTYRRLLGVNAHYKMYDGIPLILTDQKEYFTIHNKTQ